MFSLLVGTETYFSILFCKWSKNHCFYGLKCNTGCLLFDPFFQNLLETSKTFCVSKVRAPLLPCSLLSLRRFSFVRFVFICWLSFGFLLAPVWLPLALRWPALAPVSLSFHSCIGLEDTLGQPKGYASLDIHIVGLYDWVKGYQPHVA